MTWQLASFLILGLALALGFAWYERSRPPARVLALVAALAALAVVGRLAFAPLPNVKPTTDIVLFAGYALGGAPGFAVGAVTALVSNVFLSHGPWTPWQMVGWGSVGIAGGALGAVVRGWRWRGRRSDAPAASEARELGRWGLALACGLAGLGFGIVMDVYMWTLAADQTAASYVAVAARSLPFNVAHIVGNVVFCLLIGPPLVRALRRYRRRFEVRWAAPAAPRAHATGVSVAVALLTGAMMLAGAPGAQADETTARAERYLMRAQNEDGGVGRAPGHGSSAFMTSWASLGLAAAGHNSRDVSRERASLMDYLRRNVAASDDTNDLERAIVVLRAAGYSPRRFEGGELYQELLRRREGNGGSFDEEDKIDLAAFGVLALRAAGERPSSGRVRGTARWLERQADPEDGGFGFKPGEDSDVDNTALVLQALAAAGRSGGETADDAVGFVKSRRDPRTGGFKGRGGLNAQSTAYGVQGLLAAGGSERYVAPALRYLESLRASDGGIRPTEGSSRSTVWVTSQALAALERKTFPLEAVPRQPTRPPPPTDKPTEETGDVQGAVGNNDQRGGRTPPRQPPGGSAGTGSGSGSGGGTGPAVGATSPSAGPGAIGTAAVPETGPPLNLDGLSGAIGAAGALATPSGSLPGVTASQPKTPGQLLSNSPGLPATPVAASKPLGPKKDSPAPRVGAGVLLVVLVAGGLLLATGGGARARRLWAAARRRTS